MLYCECERSDRDKEPNMTWYEQERERVMQMVSDAWRIFHDVTLSEELRLAAYDKIQRLTAYWNL